MLRSVICVTFRFTPVIRSDSSLYYVHSPPCNFAIHPVLRYHSMSLSDSSHVTFSHPCATFSHHCFTLSPLCYAQPPCITFSNPVLHSVTPVLHYHLGLRSVTLVLRCHPRVTFSHSVLRSELPRVTLLTRFTLLPSVTFRVALLYVHSHPMLRSVTPCYVKSLLCYVQSSLMLRSVTPCHVQLPHVTFRVSRVTFSHPMLSSDSLACNVQSPQCYVQSPQCYIQSPLCYVHATRITFRVSPVLRTFTPCYVQSPHVTFNHRVTLCLPMLRSVTPALRCHPHVTFNHPRVRS